MNRQIDCVIWDVGNVLIRWDPYRLYRRRGMKDAEIAAMIAETDLMAHNLRFDAGAPFAEGVAALAQQFPHWSDHVLAFDHAWEEMLDGAIAPSVAALASLQANGIPCHAITNFARTKFDKARALFPFLNTFDDLVVSADVGLVKPDPAIFRLLIARRGLEPVRSLFIDDSEKNIATAESLGLRVHLFDQNSSDLAAVLASHGIAL